MINGRVAGFGVYETFASQSIQGKFHNVGYLEGPGKHYQSDFGVGVGHYKQGLMHGKGMWKDSEIMKYVVCRSPPTSCPPTTIPSQL